MYVLINYHCHRMNVDLEIPHHHDASPETNGEWTGERGGVEEGGKRKRREGREGRREEFIEEKKKQVMKKVYDDLS